MEVLEVAAEFPPKLIAPLFHGKYRYRTFVGGRSGSKSWSIARALLLKGVANPLRILCVRETMASMKQSVWRLLADQIIALGLSNHYTVEQGSIYSRNGTVFSFAGIRNSVDGLKSYEGTDICWAEESHNITHDSWEVLIPTIRKEGSEIWISFNPDLQKDESYQRFVVSPPPNSILTKINFTDNPFCPEVMKLEAAFMKETDPDAYRNVWLGEPKIFLENAVYGRELRAAIEENRITKVPHEPLVAVSAFFDLGWRDSTSIILAQVVAGEFRIIDFVQGSSRPIIDYLKILQAKPYLYGTYYLPHDGAAKSLGTGRSIQEIMQANGCKVQLVPRLSIEDGINAARTVFGRTWIDETKCAELIQCLQEYKYDLSGIKPTPVHDASSHAADAFRYCAIALRAPKATPTSTHRQYRHASGSSWMA